MIEDQETVSKWASDTFGKPTIARAATRVLEELTEFLVDCAVGNRDKLNVECADIQITLFNLADALGIDLEDEVDQKMTINRQRKWKLDGSGCGQHMEE